MIPVALTIAGSDPSGGAGLQADLKTFHQFGVYGQAVVSLITIQNSLGVSRVEPLAPELVQDQIAAVLSDVLPGAIKTGALSGAAVISAVAGALGQHEIPLVVDPVLGGSTGAGFLDPAARAALLEELIPGAFLVTPNLREAELLTGLHVTNLESMEAAARKLLDGGARNALVKGGHLEGDAVDLLVTPTGTRAYSSPRIATRHSHGTGCTLSAAITACLARGVELEASIARAKTFVSAAIRTNPGLGAGSGPLNHFAREQ